MNGQPNRGLWLIGGIITTAMVIILASIIVGNGDRTGPPAAQAPAPAQQAPKQCITSLGQKVTATTGEMGACAPAPVITGLPNLSRPRGVRFIDLSNNNPITASGMKAVKSRGYRGVVLKINQAGYIDPFAASMARDARAAGLQVGGYDFADPTRVGPIQEAHIAILRAKTLHLCTGTDIVPITLDAEYGSLTPGYINVWTRLARAACGKIQIYTGQWYWNPHIGCHWPANVPGWISAYGVPDIKRYLPCGIGHNLLEHQYTDREFNGANVSDSSVFFGSVAQWDIYTERHPSKKARHVCAGLNVLRHHTKKPLHKAQRQRVRIGVRFMHRNNLSCTRHYLRRINRHH